MRRKDSSNHVGLSSIHIKHFKAIRDSGSIGLTPFTVLIGNNGSGKSSLIEALEFMREVRCAGLDEALVRWRGIEHVWNKAEKHVLKQGKGQYYYHSKPISFQIGWRNNRERITHEMVINAGEAYDQIYIQQEIEKRNGRVTKFRDDAGWVKYPTMPTEFFDWGGEDRQFYPGSSCLDCGIEDTLVRSLFLNLSPDAIVRPSPQHRASHQNVLARDGSNLAEYLLDIRHRDLNAFNQILESLQIILPFASDVQPTLTTEMQRTIYLQITEGGFKIPGWLFSTGTARILALLAVLRDPTPPPVLLVEEIENGLDPRTINILIGEIRNVVESGKMQVIVTTHSPYLLDLVEHEHVILVERDKQGEPKFVRPSSIDELSQFRKQYSPGRLYTNYLLNRENV